MLTIKEILQLKTPLLFDGAMGTLLYNKGLFINRCFEMANIENQALVLEIHNDYIKAGAQVITTNSWGANFFKLQKHNFHDRIYEVNFKAAELARRVAQDKVYVAGSVGPLGVRMEPWGPTSFDEAKNAFAQQIKALAQGGVDFILLETFEDITEIEQAIKAAQEVAPELPIFACLMIDLQGSLPLGTPIEWAAKTLDKWKVDVLGLNCSVGPGPMLSAYDKIRSVTEKPIILMPNAGFPKLVDGRQIYMSTPEYFAEFTKEFLKAGVQFVGGCCGTTPEHIKTMYNVLRYHYAMSESQTRGSSGLRSNQRVKIIDPAESKRVAPIEFKEKSAWSAKIAAGEKVTTIELLPPTGVFIDKLIEQAIHAKKSGVDAINIPDGPRASARMSALATALMIKQKAGIEPVLHYTCRDRNLLGMQSDMIGLHALGIHNVLLVTGDPPKMGAYPDATGVFDVDAIGLTNMVCQLNCGLDLGNRPIGEPTALSIGVGANPVARDLSHEKKRFIYKVEAGAEWAITQPIFEPDSLLRFIDFCAQNKVSIPFIAGVWPLTSYRNAVFMHNEVPGVVIPQKIMQRMENVKNDPEEARKIGIDIAREMIECIEDVIHGVQVSAPFGRMDLALKVLGKA